ncbi:MAG: VWA domain-containing protein [Candidatus Aminicenantes bacterium]|jgi:VWFA-related protein
MTLKKILRFLMITCFVLVFLAHYVLTGAQQKKAERPSSIIHEVEVRITKVDVIVTDKEGNRITGLKPENFKLYEDGIIQPLTNFYEVQGMEVFLPAAEREVEKPSIAEEPPPAAVPVIKNKIVIYFDNWHLHPMNRNWGIKKLMTFIEKNFPPGTNNEAMVVSLDQKLEIIQKFTSNQQLLTLAIKEVKKRSGQTLLRKKAKEQLRKELTSIVTDTSQFDRYAQVDSYERALGYARNFVEAEQADLIFSLKSLNAVVSNLAGIEGKKILIYVSDGLPINPGDEAFTFLDQAFPRENARSEAMTYDATRIFKELTAKCNANEISLYPINAQGLESVLLSADKQDGWGVHARGAGMMRVGSRYQNDALTMMAKDTGGVAILNTNDIETGLEKIKNDLMFYYTLGYKSLHQEDNKFHAINVKLVGLKEDYNVRVRQGFKQISEEQKIKESVTSGLFLRRQNNALGLRVQILPVESMVISKNLRLTLKLLIPIKNLVLNRERRNYKGEIKVYLSLKDAEGKLSPIQELSEEIKIPGKDYEQALKSYYPYLVEMYVKPGQYTISLAVRDVPAASTSYVQLDRYISPPRASIK